MLLHPLHDKRFAGQLYLSLICLINICLLLKFRTLNKLSFRFARNIATQRENFAPLSFGRRKCSITNVLENSVPSDDTFYKPNSSYVYLLVYSYYQNLPRDHRDSSLCYSCKKEGLILFVVNLIEIH